MTLVLCLGSLLAAIIWTDGYHSYGAGSHIPIWLRGRSPNIKSPLRGSCQDLFPQRDPLMKFSEPFMKGIRLFNNSYTEMSQIYTKMSPPHLSTSPRGYDFRLFEEMGIIRGLAKLPWVKKVCEFGFGSGHGAATWLSDSSLHLFVFTQANDSFTQIMADFFQNTYSFRFTLVRSDLSSAENLTHRPSAFRCDIVSVHLAQDNSIKTLNASDKNNTDFSISKSNSLFGSQDRQFQFIQRFVSPRNIILLDGYPNKLSVIKQKQSELWERHLKLGDVGELFRCSYLVNHPRGVGGEGMLIGWINT